MSEKKDCMECKRIDDTKDNELPCTECIHNPNLPSKLIDHFDPKEVV